MSYQHGVQNVLDLLAAGDADAAVLIRPTGIDEIRRTATEHLLMPPKSTFFTPKLRTGSGDPAPRLRGQATVMEASR